MARQIISIFALLAVAVAAASAAELDCAGPAAVESITKAVSALRVNLRKEPPAVMCQKFVSGVVSEAASVGLVAKEGGNGLEKFQQVVEAVRARAECVAKSSPLAANGLRALVSYMTDCAGQSRADVNVYELPEAPAPKMNWRAARGLEQTHQKLQAELGEKRKQLEETKALTEQVGARLAEAEAALQRKAELEIANDAELQKCKPTLERLEVMRKNVHRLERDAASLAAANKEQREQIALKSGEQSRTATANRNAREQLVKLDALIRDVSEERESWRKTAETNLAHLRKCRS